MATVKGFDPEMGEYNMSEATYYLKKYKRSGQRKKLLNTIMKESLVESDDTSEGERRKVICKFDDGSKLQILYRNDMLYSMQEIQ